MRLLKLAIPLFITFHSVGLGQAKGTHVDYAFLVDVSASMVGQAGHTNIFPSVQSTIQEFVSQIKPGSNVFFFPFAEKIQETRAFKTSTAQDVKAIRDYVDALIANGQSTAVFNSVEEVLRKIDAFREQEKERRPFVFFVYTDGDDNVSKSWSLSSILNHFNLKRGKDDWLFYTELGLPRDLRKEEQFKKFDRMQYIQEEVGQVHPIIQIETAIPILNFGNLKQTLRSIRIEKFNVLAKDSLTANYTVTIEPQFEELKSQGAYAQVSPAVFYPAESVNLELALINSQQIKEGKYAGRFHLSSSDPLVIIVPNDVEVSFIFEPERIVQILPTGGGTFPISLGELELTHDALVEARKSLFVRFNRQAEQSGEKLKVRLTEDLDNPQYLDLGIDIAMLQIPGHEGVVGPQMKQLDLVFKGKSHFSAGDYRGQIIFEAENLNISGNGLNDLKDNPRAKSVNWSFHLNSPPWSWWVWLLAVIGTLLGLIVLLFALYCLKEGVGPSEGVENLSAIWFPVLDGELEILEPEAKQGNYRLKGQKQMNVGRGGQILTELDAAFRLDPTIHLGKRAVKISASEDSIVKVDGTPVFSENIFDGQLIELGKSVRVKIRYNNIRLPKPD